jgi:Fe2+ transport system protein FeoA
MAKKAPHAYVPTDALRQEVEERASAGQTVQHIANELDLAVSTVEIHYQAELEAGWESLTSLAFSALKRNMLQKQNLHASNAAAALLIDRLAVVRKIRRVERKLQDMGLTEKKVIDVEPEALPPPPMAAKPEEAKVSDIRSAVRQRAAQAAASRTPS